MATARTLALGDTEVVRIGLGTNRLRKTRENIELIRQAVDAGVGMVDTAHNYADGESEATIGEALSTRSGRVVVATKGGFATGTGSAEAPERATRREPAAPAHRRDRPLLPAPRRPRDATRGEPRHDRRISRPRTDPPRRPFGGQRRADRARAASRPDRGRPESLQPGGARPRRGR